jgi:hypothetical protein
MRNTGKRNLQLQKGRRKMELTVVRSGQESIPVEAIPAENGNGCLVLRPVEIESYEEVLEAAIDSAVKAAIAKSIAREMRNREPIKSATYAAPLTDKYISPGHFKFYYERDVSDEYLGTWWEHAYYGDYDSVTPAFGGGGQVKKYSKFDQQAMKPSVVRGRAYDQPDKNWKMSKRRQPRLPWIKRSHEWWQRHHNEGINPKAPPATNWAKCRPVFHWKSKPEMFRSA